MSNAATSVWDLRWHITTRRKHDYKTLLQNWKNSKARVKMQLTRSATVAAHSHRPLWILRSFIPNSMQGLYASRCASYGVSGMAEQ